ncbi:hypothetical protein BDR22DRAFT_657071 [Usnea florida]
MATTPTLLKLPLEMRHHMYAYLLPMTANINMVRDDLDGPLKNSLFRVCRDISSEALNYYYSTNSFLLDLTEPTYAPNRFHSGTTSLLKYIRPIQTLQLVIGESFSPEADPGSLSDYDQEQFDWFLRTLQEANKDAKGLWLRNLTILDHCVTFAVAPVTPLIVERAQKRRDIFALLLEPLKSKIRHIKIESRALSQIRRLHVASGSRTGR